MAVVEKDVSGPVIRLHADDNVVVARTDVGLGQSIPGENVTSRAQVAAGLNLAGGAKAMVTEYYAENGAFPGSRDSEDMTIGPGTVDYVQLLTVEPFTGTITIDYASTVAGTGSVSASSAIEIAFTSAVL